jgi:hypothetical protein
VQHCSFKDAACGELVGQVGTVVVYETLQVFDGSGEDGTRCAVVRRERAET